MIPFHFRTRNKVILAGVPSVYPLLNGATTTLADPTAVLFIQRTINAERNRMPDHIEARPGVPFTGKHTPRLTEINVRKGTPTIMPAISGPEKRANRGTTQLQLPGGRCDFEAVKAVIGDWLVPLLVEEFLMEQKASMKSAEVDSSQPTMKAAGRKR